MKIIIYPFRGFIIIIRGYNIVYPEKIFVWHYYTRKECNKIWSDLSQDLVDKKVVKKGW
ncbi:TPA: hypothetical protein I7721_15500 [Vibrio vulnificus]|uniref:GlcNAc-transferase family protein n=1 Tax=Morganella morganii TaxID=582 RepID=UPI001A339951|nr:hypothetical protein [Vibrio vulnificus]